MAGLGAARITTGEANAIEFHNQAERKTTISDQHPAAPSKDNALLRDVHTGIAYYTSALGIARDLGDKLLEAFVLGGLGIGYRLLGESRTAIGLQEQRLDIARAMGDRRLEANALCDLSVIYMDQRQWSKAFELHEQQLTIASELGDRLIEGPALLNSAVALDQLGDRLQAKARAEAALQIFKAAESPAVQKVAALLDKLRDKPVR